MNGHLFSKEGKALVAEVQAMEATTWQSSGFLSNSAEEGGLGLDPILRYSMGGSFPVFDPHAVPLEASFVGSGRVGPPPVPAFGSPSGASLASMAVWSSDGLRTLQSTPTPLRVRGGPRLEMCGTTGDAGLAAATDAGAAAVGLSSCASAGATMIEPGTSDPFV